MLRPIQENEGEQIGVNVDETNKEITVKSVLKSQIFDDNFQLLPMME